VSYPKLQILYLKQLETKSTSRTFNFPETELVQDLIRYTCSSEPLQVTVTGVGWFYSFEVQHFLKY